jgi:hypothetical protein
MLVDMTGEQYPAPIGGVTSLRARPTGGPAAALFLSLDTSGQGCLRVIFPLPRSPAASSLSSPPSSSPLWLIRSSCLPDTVASV